MDNAGSNTIGNPVIYLRLGQCRYELKECDKVANKLARVFCYKNKNYNI